MPSNESNHLTQCQTDQGVDLKQVSIARLLFGILEAKLSGILSLQDDKLLRRIAFLSGVPTQVTSNIRAETFGPLLQRLGKITETEAQKILTLASPQQTPLTMLQSLGRFADTDIQKLIELVQSERLRLVFSARQGNAKFTTSPTTPPTISQYLRHYLDGMTAHIDEAHIATHFSEVQNHNSVTFHQDRFYQLEKMLTPEERGVAMVGSTSSTVQEIISQSLLTPKEKQLGLVKLLLLGVLQFESVSAKEERQLLSTLNPEQQILRRQVDKLMQDDAKGELNYFQLFAVQPNASRADLENAYKALQQRFSTKLLLPLFLESQQNKTSELGKLLLQAYQLLSNDQKRLEYAEFINSGKGGRFENQSKVVAIEAAIEQGQRFLDKQRYSEAYQVFQQVLKTMPRDARMLAWAGYCYYLTGQANAKGKELLLGAYKLEPTNADALAFLGDIALRENDSEAAQKWLKLALTQDPKHAHAKSLLGGVDGGESLKIEIEAIHKNLQELDYYAILDTPRTAKLGDIQRAYHRKTKQFHPDRFFTQVDYTLKDKARTLYKRCVEAYMVLKNPMKRKEYDQQLDKAKSGEAQVRLKDAADVMQKKEKFEQTIKSPQAKKYFGLGMTALQMGNLSSAVMNLQLALNSEPNHPLISQRLQEARDKASRN